MRDLEGKLVLVTGAGKGVGKVIARQFAERGADIIVNFFHSLEAAKQARAELESMGARVEMIRASVAQPHQVERMFAEIEERFGYLDILVNNAASGALVPADKVTEEYLDRALDTNLKGSFWCARHAAPLMARRGGGCIVNLSSIGAGMVTANYLAVGTSKAAVESLTRYLAVEYAPLNIRVNTASATLLDGEVARLFPRSEELKQVSIECTPLGRLGTAEDLAGVVMFLTSDQSRWVTGQTILADGGLSLGSASLSPPPVHRPLRSLPGPVGNRAEGVAEESNGHAVVAGTIETDTTPPPAPPAPAAALAADAAREPADGEDIAIVGMGLVVPGARSPEEYWQVLMAGPDLVTTVPADRWDYRTFFSPDLSAEDKTYQSKSVFITDSPVQPATANQPEMTTAWLRHSLLQAMQGVTRREGDRFSFVVGYTADGSQHLEESLVLTGALHHCRQALEDMPVSAADREESLREVRRTLEQRYWRGASSPSAFLPHKVGYDAMDGVLPPDTGLQMVDTACSSSLYTVDIGIKGLLMGKHDIAVCGGAFALAPRGAVLFAKLHGLSTGGEVRALDKDSDGVLFADGAGVVVLKKLSRALADGDTVLAVVQSFGSSSDGRGKAIYAPSSAGQSIAIRRALERPNVDLGHVDWVVAHATGTPAGDLAEFSTLREMIRSDHPVYVTSNKSVIGHAGWAAGVASLIEVILGLQKQAIPPQHRFSAPPPEFEYESGDLEIPLSPVPWQPHGERPRAASVSGFGFGGTNAHVILQEYAGEAPPGPTRERADRERVAIVAWAAHLPAVRGPEDVMAWLGGGEREPAESFGDFYPMPSFEKVRMPPATVRTLDRCQLMLLECAHDLRRQLGDFWAEKRETTGVIVGHMGPTRTATLYAARCYLDDLEQTLRADDRLAASPLLEPLLESVRQRVRHLVPPANENSFPGMMPNVIPARVANFFDLKGLNMTVDTGFSSTLSAFEVAARYLRTLDLDMALVGGINGNTTPEMQQILHDLARSGEMRAAEGAFLFALVRETTARDRGLPVLGYVGELATGAPAPPDGTTVECGLCAAGAGRHNYLGAEGARGVLQALRALRGPKSVVCRGESGIPDAVLTLEPPTREDPAANHIPSQYFNAEECAPGKPMLVKRQVPRLDEVPWQPVRPRIDFFAPGTLILTDQPGLLSVGELPPEVTVLSTSPLSTPTPNHLGLPDPTPETVGGVLARVTHHIRHVRLLTDLTRSAPPPACLWQEPVALLKLHDLTFLILQRCHDALTVGGASFAALCLGALPSGCLHPFTGLWTGLIKSLAIEIPDCHSYAVVTSTGDVREAIRQAEVESAAKQLLPIVV
ncbi:MAG: SDR family oxidoreductase, partial [Chloroflexi bacterium]|nr:SDR family oxidoreductase [Chloroflexota bacterium]